MSLQEAKTVVNNVYPKPVSNPVYINNKIDCNIDVSIIIPVYNHEDIIEETISAALRQRTKYRYEIIIIDDGSTDNAAKVIKKFEYNSKVKIIYQQNGGIAFARNTGINNAKGKYLMFVDCDDLVKEDIVEVLLDEVYKADYDIVMCAHNFSKQKGGKVYKTISNIYSKYNLMGYKNGDKIMNYPGLPWCKVYKRELWNKVRFFPGYWYEDTIIQFLIFMQCKDYSYIPKVEYEYKWYESNFSHIQGNSKNLKSIDSYWLLVEILQQYKEMQLPINEALYTLVLRHISAYYYTSIKGLDENVVTALFVLAKELYLEYKPKHRVKLPFLLRMVEKSFDDNDIILWKLVSGYL